MSSPITTSTRCSSHNSIFFSSELQAAGFNVLNTIDSDVPSILAQHVYSRFTVKELLSFKLVSKAMAECIDFALNLRPNVYITLDRVTTDEVEQYRQMSMARADRYLHSITRVTLFRKDYDQRLSWFNQSALTELVVIGLGDEISENFQTSLSTLSHLSTLNLSNVTVASLIIPESVVALMLRDVVAQQVILPVHLHRLTCNSSRIQVGNWEALDQLRHLNFSCNTRDQLEPLQAMVSSPLILGSLEELELHFSTCRDLSTPENRPFVSTLLEKLSSFQTLRCLILRCSILSGLSFPASLQSLTIQFCSTDQHLPLLPSNIRKCKLALSGTLEDDFGAYQPMIEQCQNTTTINASVRFCLKNHERIPSLRSTYSRLFLKISCELAPVSGLPDSIRLIKYIAHVPGKGRYTMKVIGAKGSLEIVNPIMDDDSLVISEEARDLCLHLPSAGRTILRFVQHILQRIDPVKRAAALESLKDFIKNG